VYAVFCTYYLANFIVMLISFTFSKIGIILTFLCYNLHKIKHIYFNYTVCWVLANVYIGFFFGKCIHCNWIRKRFFFYYPRIISFQEITHLALERLVCYNKKMILRVKVLSILMYAILHKHRLLFLLRIMLRTVTVAF
jgi:hypothetical protein